MPEDIHHLLSFQRHPVLEQGTLILAFTGWMDGGEVSTGTVRRLGHLLEAEPFAEIDPEPFYLYNFPGSMELTALFRPPVVIEEGVIQSLEMPRNVFFVREDSNLALFIGKEPNLQWRAFGQCIVTLAHQVGIRRILFIGSFGGTVPHTREPRLFVSATDEALLVEVAPFGVRRSTYAGPGSFTTYLMTQAKSAGLDMLSLTAEIPGYLQGTNPLCIEAVTRRLAKILHLPLDLASLRAASTEWELEVSSAVEQNPELAEKVRELEDQYDKELVDQAGDEA